MTTPDVIFLSNEPECPFTYELDRKLGDRKPCPERYRPTCGCQKDGIPSIRMHWKRSAT